MSIRLVGVIVRPLTRYGADIDALLPEQFMGGECVVRVDVPILHSPDDIHAAVVVIKNILQVVAFFPIIVPLVASEACS